MPLVALVVKYEARSLSALALIVDDGIVDDQAAFLGQRGGKWLDDEEPYAVSAMPTPSASAAILVPSTRFLIFWNATSRA